MEYFFHLLLKIPCDYGTRGDLTLTKSYACCNSIWKFWFKYLHKEVDKGMKQNWYLSSAVAYSEPSQVFYFLREKIVKNVEPCQTSKIKLLEILQNICNAVVYSELFQKFKKEIFEEKFNGWKLTKIYLH